MGRLISIHKTVSVVVTSYNHASYIESALNSVFAQTLSPLEVIVVDDCSTDNSAEIIKKYGPKVIFLQNETNLGGAATTSKGVAAANGDYLAIINSDDVWHPNKLESQMRYLETNKFDFVFSQAEIIDGESAKLLNPPKQFDNFRFMSKPKFGSFLLHFYLLGNFLCHSSFLGKTQLFQSTGPYDNRYRQLPDFNKWIQLSKIGRIGIVPEPLVQYRYLGLGNTSSSASHEVLLRTRYEHFMTFCNFFDGLSTTEIHKNFSKLIKNKKYIESKADLVCGLLLSHPDYSLSKQAKLAALIWLQNNCDSPELQLKFHKLTGSQDIFHLLSNSRVLISLMRKLAWSVWNRRI